MEKLMDLGKMDNYYEQTVKRQFAPGSFAAMIIGLIFITITIILSVYLSTYFGILVPIAILLFALGVYIIYYLIKNTHVEYEYTFVRGEMRIEKIKGNTRRRKVAIFDVKSIDDIERYINPETGKPNIDKSKFKVVLSAAQTESSLETYYVVIHDKVRQKHALLLFTPDQITLDKIKPYLSIELKKKYILMQKKYAELESKKPDENDTDTDIIEEKDEKIDNEKETKKEELKDEIKNETKKENINKTPVSEKLYKKKNKKSKNK